MTNKQNQNNSSVCITLPSWTYDGIAYSSYGTISSCNITRKHVYAPIKIKTFEWLSVLRWTKDGSIELQGNFVCSKNIERFRGWLRTTGFDKSESVLESKTRGLCLYYPPLAHFLHNVRSVLNKRYQTRHVTYNTYNNHINPLSERVYMGMPPCNLPGQVNIRKIVVV